MIPSAIVKGAALAVALLTCTAVLWWQGRTIDGLREALVAEQRAVAASEVALATGTQALDRLREALAARDRALAERDRTLAIIEQERSAARRTLQEVLRNDATARAWADVPVPAAVLGLLRTEPADSLPCGGAGDATDPVASPDPGAAVDRGDQR